MPVKRKCPDIFKGSMKYIDAHCHLHDPRIIREVDAIVERAGAVHIHRMVSCATREENFRLTADLSRRYSAILPCFGIHPWFVEGVSDQWKAHLEQSLLSCPSGIGETGLDFTDKTCDRDLQLSVLAYHLKLARELGRPITIHIRKAWDPFIRLLKKTEPLAVPGMLHAYSGSADMIPFFETRGFYISFSGGVTNPGAKRIVTALEAVSKDRFVLETDAPDALPVNLTGGNSFELNEPKNLPEIVKVASNRIGVSCEDFANQAYENALTLFDPIIKET